MNKSSLKILKNFNEKSSKSKLRRINLLSIASNERSPKQMADCDLFLYSPVVAIARTRVKNPYALAQISPSTNPSDLWEARLNFKSIEPLRSMSKLQIYQTFGKHVQNSNPWTSGKHVKNSRSLVL